MALGDVDSRLSVEKDDPKRFSHSLPGEKDVEKQDSTRRGSRIAAPRRGSILDDSDDSISLGALIEAEKDNAIKYRTCSWQKVRLFL